MLSIFGERYYNVCIEGNLCSPGSSLSYVHMTYPDLLNFSMHEKNRTESIITQRGKCICMHVRF